MTSPFNPLTHLRRLQQARRLRRGAGPELPAWALGEIKLSPAQAGWLLRTLCSWHALPLRGGLPGPDAAAAIPLVGLVTQLAAQGVGLRACRLADARALGRGDVVMLGDSAASRLFGGPAVAGAGMALVIDAGPETLRLSPALAPDPLSCHSRELQGNLAGWVLRSELLPGLRSGRTGWRDELAAAL